MLHENLGCANLVVLLDPAHGSIMDDLADSSFATIFYISASAASSLAGSMLGRVAATALDGLKAIGRLDPNENIGIPKQVNHGRQGVTGERAEVA
jgi:hypothetical protein